MEQFSFASLLMFSEFRSTLSRIQAFLSEEAQPGWDQEALTFLAYLKNLKVSQLSLFLHGEWDFNADYPNASRYVRGSKLQINFTRHENIPDLAILELKAAFIVYWKALSAVPDDDNPMKVNQPLSKPNTVISIFESGLRFLDKLYAVAADELGKEHVEIGMASLVSLPAHFYATAAGTYDYVFDENLLKFFKVLHSVHLEQNVFGSPLPRVDLTTLEWKILGGTLRPESEKVKKKQVLENKVFEISSLKASFAIVDFLEAMGDEVVDKASLKRKIERGYREADNHGVNPLKFNIYTRSRLAAKGFSHDQVMDVLGDSAAASMGNYLFYNARTALNKYKDETGSGFGDEFRKYLSSICYACHYIIGQYTGMRPSELAELLTDSCVQFDGRFWLLRSAVTKHEENLVELFDDFWIAIPIVRDAVRVCAWMKKFKNNDYVYSSMDTVPWGEKSVSLSRSGVQHTIDGFFQKNLPPEVHAKLDFNPYMLRHTLAHQLYRADLGLPFISHQLKHFGEIVGVSRSERYSKTTLSYGELADKMASGGGRGSQAESLRHQAEKESNQHRFDPDGNYAGVNAQAHKERLQRVFQGYMAAGYTKDEIFEAMTKQHIAVISVGQGFCYGGKSEEFDSSIPCVGSLRCNPNRCKNAIVSKANAPSWREVYYQNKALLRNPDFAYNHVQIKAAMEEAYGVLQLLGEEL
ncbi:site-specific integrase [Pseudomonas putida]|nr:site-specific integrase [Pseudomonas putida]